MSIEVPGEAEQTQPDLEEDAARAEEGTNGEDQLCSWFILWQVSDNMEWVGRDSDLGMPTYMIIWE